MTPPNGPLPEGLTGFMNQLCDAAERETMPRFRLQPEVENKAAGAFDPVTEADRSAERAIRALIGARYPDHDIMGEETGGTLSGAEYCWHIDPVDGTRAFICGLPSWGTLIGLARNGRAVAGIMHQPFTGERFVAAGDGAFLWRGKDLTRLKSRGTTQLKAAVLMTTSPNIFPPQDAPLYRRLEKACRMARYGFDCYAYAMVAAGHVDLVVESGLKSYDIAALIPIIEQAGGVVSDWQGANALPGGRIIAAANPALHVAALELLA